MWHWERWYKTWDSFGSSGNLDLDYLSLVHKSFPGPHVCPPISARSTWKLARFQAEEAKKNTHLHKHKIPCRSIVVSSAGATGKDAKTDTQSISDWEISVLASTFLERQRNAMLTRKLKSKYRRFHVRMWVEDPFDTHQKPCSICTCSPRNYLGNHWVAGNNS